MNVSLSTLRPYPGRPLAALGKLTAAALVGLAGLLTYGQLMFGGTNAVIIALTLLPLVLAGVVATGRRWAPLLGTLVFGLLVTLLTLGMSEVRFILAHPEDFRPFSLVVVALALVAVGLLASIGAALQNYHSAEPRTPRGLALVLTALGSLVGGALLIAGITSTSTEMGLSPQTLQSLPAVTLHDFDGGTVRVKAGESIALRLENTHFVPHQFDVDALGVHTLMPSDSDSLAVFAAPTPGSYLFYCAPHYNKATGEGMYGTLIVE